VGAGSNATFRVIASGTDPMRYQWHFNAAPVSGATNATLLLTAVTSNSAGPYSVVITNIAGVATSQIATLTVMIADANTDTDRDGMPDWWENLYTLQPTNSSDASVDSDNDRMSNLEEFRAGTNPRDASSLLKLQVSVTPSVHLRFTAQSNIAYVVQFSTNIPPNPSLVLSNIVAQPGVRAVDLVDPGAGSSSRFYRVMVP
jgi:hypothetical protein